MKEKFDIIGLTNVLTDVIIPATDEDIAFLGLKKGFHNRMTWIDQHRLKDFLKNREQEYCAGGSPANVIFDSAALGLKTGLIGVVGDDIIGSDYLMDLVERGIKDFIDIQQGESGICYTLISDDGEKTSFSGMGVAAKFSLERCLDIDDLPETRFFHTSGYELYSNPSETLKIMNAMANNGARISFDLGDPRMVAKNRDLFLDVAKRTEVLFMTEEESSALTEKSPEDSLEYISKICPVVILKKGSNGSSVRSGEERYDIPIYPVEVISKCGAGDAYAAGFLSARLNGLDLEKCGHSGSYIASRVCGLKSPHLVRD